MPNLRSRSVERQQTLPRVRLWSMHIYKIPSELWGHPPKYLAAPCRNIKTLAISRLNREYLRNTTRWQTENVIANCDHSHTGYILDWVDFGLQTAKNWTGISTHPKRATTALGIGTSSSCPGIYPSPDHLATDWTLRDSRKERISCANE